MQFLEKLKQAEDLDVLYCKTLMSNTIHTITERLLKLGSKATMSVEDLQNHQIGHAMVDNIAAKQIGRAGLQGDQQQGQKSLDDQQASLRAVLKPGAQNQQQDGSQGEQAPK